MKKRTLIAMCFIVYALNGYSQVQSGGPGDLPDPIDQPGTLSNIWLQNGSTIYYNQGNVGIGTTSPDSKLTVNGSQSWHIATNKNLKVNDWDLAGNGGFSLFTYNDNNTSHVPISFVASSYYFHDGNVGIGTSNPVQKLEVQGNIKLHNDGGFIQKVKGIYFTWDANYGLQFEHGIFSTNGTNYSDNITLNSYGNVRINFDSNNNGVNNFSIGNHTTGLSNTFFSIIENGNVGIGTEAPAEKLHVNGNIRGHVGGGAVRIQSASGYLDIGSQNSSWTHFNTDRPAYYFNTEIRVDNGLIGSYDEDLQLRTAGVTGITLKTNGSVGIGTLSPAYKLHAAGDIYADGGWLRVSGNSGLYFESHGGGFYMADNDWIRTYNNKNFYHNVGVMRTDGVFHVGPNGDRFVVNEAGNAGIGTINPTKKLDVNGDINFTGNLFKNGQVVDLNGGGNSSLWKENGADIFFNTGNVGIGTASPGSKLTVNGAQTWHIAANKNLTLTNWDVSENGCVTFNSYTDDNLSHIPVSFAASSFYFHGGRVGIGISNPQSELAVNGIITAKGIEVSQEGWPDFVFHKDYSLMNINELKNFIEQNSHLPNVPSENEVKEKGLNLGDMDAILLQKVEELTLYIIQLETRISELENK